MIKRLLRKYQTLKYANSQKYKIKQDGALLNAFYSTRTIFIHIPKTAGVSLVKSIFGHVTLEGHRSVSFYKQVFGTRYSDFFTFTIVRNPWDRLYSAYKFLQKGGINIHDKNAFETHLSTYKDFEDFVLKGLNEKIIWEIMHLIPQYEFVCDKNGKIIVDYVGRFESLQEDVAGLSKKINLEVVMGHYNYNKKKDYREAYTKEMIEKVHHIYQKDIDVFEYSFK